MSRPAPVGAGSARRRGTPSPLPLIAVLTGVQFLVVFDGLAVALALPSIGADLSMSPAGLAWVVSAYSLALAGGLLLAGRVSDLYGRRPVLLAGLALLTAGALAAALAGSPGVLVAARLLQGAGAALAYPPALSLTAESFPEEPWRGRAFAAGAIAGSTGTVAGAVFGGVVTGTLGWSWTFGLTVPPGVLLLALGLRFLPAARPARSMPGSRLRRLDLPSAALAAAALTVLLLALSRVEEAGPTDPLVWAGGAGAAVLFGLLVAQQRRAPAPLLPGSLVGSRRLIGGSVGIAANSVVYSAVVFIGTLQLQRGVGLTPVQAGLAFLPVSVTSLLAGALVVTRVRRRLGSAPTAVTGLVLGLAGLVLLAAAPDQPTYSVHVLPGFLIIGVALTAALVSFTEHTIGGAPPDTRGVTSGVFETSTHLGGAVSVTAFAVALSSTGRSDGYPVAYGIAAALVTVGAVTAATLLLRGSESRE